MKSILIIMLVAGMISCEAENTEPKTVDMEKFTIRVPASWKATKEQGIDSYIGQFKINDREIVTFDLGDYSNPLNENPASHDIDFRTIDSKRSKVVKPKNFGLGTTGVYFDSLETTRTVKFNMSGTGLSRENQQLFLAAIETLRFRN